MKRKSDKTGIPQAISIILMLLIIFATAGQALNAEAEQPQALGSNIIRSLKAKVIMQKPSSSSGSDYDSRYHILKGKLNITNSSFGDANSLSSEIYLIGKAVRGSRDYRLFRILKTEAISVPKGQKYSSEEYTCKIKYDSFDDIKFGYKYEGYLLLVKDASGVTVITKGSASKFEKIADKLAQLKENSIFDEDGNFIEKYHSYY